LIFHFFFFFAEPAARRRISRSRSFVENRPAIEKTRPVTLSRFAFQAGEVQFRVAKLRALLEAQASNVSLASAPDCVGPVRVG